MNSKISIFFFDSDMMIWRISWSSSTERPSSLPRCVIHPIQCTKPTHLKDAKSKYQLFTYIPRYCSPCEYSVAFKKEKVIGPEAIKARWVARVCVGHKQKGDKIKCSLHAHWMPLTWNSSQQSVLWMSVTYAWREERNLSAKNYLELWETKLTI
jgi:hypothetical protein